MTEDLINNIISSLHKIQEKQDLSNVKVVDIELSAQTGLFLKGFEVKKAEDSLMWLNRLTFVLNTGYKIVIPVYDYTFISEFSIKEYDSEHVTAEPITTSKYGNKIKQLLLEKLNKLK